MNNRYVIEKITDIFDIPEDRFKDFLVDFETYYNMGRPMADLIKETARIGGVNINVMPFKMTWIDDNKHDVKVIIGTKEINND